MYDKFFGLKDSPFSIAPDPRFLYMSERHREALAHLLYGVSRYGGFVMLTGEVGTGKTTVCRCFLQQVPDTTDVAFIIHPKVTARELLATICDELHIPYARGSSIKVLVDLINQHLLNAHANGRHTVVVIDEAQNLSVEVLEQLRLLTNLETAEKKLLQIILLGQPELTDLLRRPELRQLSQRITARYHLKELGKDDVRAYVHYRLSVAGLKREIFTPAALLALYKLSQGVPRLINLICDRAMLGAYAKHSEIIDKPLLKQAAREVLGETRLGSPKSDKSDWLFKGVLSGMAAGLVTLALASVWMLRSHQSEALPEEQVKELLEKPAAISGQVPRDPQTGSIARGDSQTTAAANPEPAGDQVLHLPSGADAHLDAHPVDEDSAFLEALMALPDDTQQSAFRSLFQRWQVEYNPQKSPDACRFAETAGLRCLQRQGNWRSLVQLDRPAILKLRTPAGVDFYVTAQNLLEGERMRVSLNGNNYVTERKTLDDLWSGDYALLWKVPPYQSAVITPGAVQNEKMWLTDALDRIEAIQQNLSTDSSVSSELIAPGSDLPLPERIRNFQRSEGLDVDGIAGALTLISMSSYLDKDAPRLSAAEGRPQLVGRN